MGEFTQKRVGRNLHDGLGQEPRALSLGLRSLSVELPKRDSLQGQAAGRLAELTQKSVAETQRIARLLGPSPLTEASLGAALDALCVEVGSYSEIRCRAQLLYIHLNPIGPLRRKN